ncbi:cupin domain-containing protein [Bradyrhizobium sp. CCGB12]|uniref:cupin domain-containing protein n=1 Tax=Bradyrhizobium sp. CCGB12 TaxID=2949632 RepID=UPI0020B3AB15|nr:cupin domain-containing protein [Bradyrhizobium sp. CCGB12]MCP3392275.1 cupin domain-containing protein [Bradyrhizobium sp. CCGB12]
MRKIAPVIEAKDEPVFIPWTERELNWRESPIPFIEKNGWHGALISPSINGTNFRFFPYYLPFGQARPFHITENLELIIFVLEGQIEFGVGPSEDQLQYFQLGKYDTLFVPRGRGVDYRNSGPSDARYIMANSHVGGWPTECIYNIPGQKEPFVRKF